MDIAAKLAEAQIVRVAIIDDDLSARITHADLRAKNEGAAALLNDRADPDRAAYLELLAQRDIAVTAGGDLAEPLAQADVREIGREHV